QRHEEPSCDSAAQAQALGAGFLLHEPQRRGARDDRRRDPDAEPILSQLRYRFDAYGDERRDAHGDAAIARNRGERIGGLDRAADVAQVLEGSGVDRSRLYSTWTVG